MTNKTTLKPLLHELTPFLPDYTPTCLKNAFATTLAVLRTKTTCLYKTRCALGTVLGAPGTDPLSHYKRLIRFFDDYAATDLWADLVACGLRLLRLKSAYLILDGTSWQRGERWENLLTLAVVHRGVAIPLIWHDLEKKGTSSYDDRVALLDAARERFDLRGRTLLADREYIGERWFNYLIDNGLEVCIRSRDFAYFQLVDRSGPGQPALREMRRKVRQSAKADKALRRAFRFTPGGPQFWLVCARNPKSGPGEPRDMLLITTVDQGAYETVRAYLKRWKIEHCFKHMKSNGFDLEAINLATSERRRLLTAVVVLAYILSCVEALKDYRRKVKRKRNGSDGGRWHAISVFRYGVDAVSTRIGDLITFCRYLRAELTRAMNGYRSSTLLLNV